MKAVKRRVTIVLGALLVLGAVNAAIFDKERIRRGGEIIYLQLAPVDPRSLVQGDYMALRFALVDQIERRRQDDKQSERNGDVGFAAITLDAEHIARLASDAAATPLKLRFHIRDGHVWLGTNAFFFEEGTAARFRDARYGEFRLDRTSGEAVLVGLRDDRLDAL